MNVALVKTLLQELQRMPIYDPHSHVRWQDPVAQHLGDLVGYHYFTELSNSSRGRPVPLPDDPDERIAYVWPHMPELRGTIQFDWMMGISEIFFGIPRGEWFSSSREEIVRRANKVIQTPAYADQIWQRSNISGIVMTNQFDEDLSALKDPRLIPGLRTDELVMNPDVAESIPRLDRLTGLHSGQDLASWRQAVTQVFDRFSASRMAYAACAATGSFDACEVSPHDAAALLKRIATGEKLDQQARLTWGAFALEELTKQCRRVNVPYCLMLGAERGAYAHGVPSGCDVFHSDNHMRGFNRLFNTYSDVRFPVMIISDTTSLELITAGWIRHNVYPLSHWWYSMQPVDIRRDLRRRLDVLPHNKFIAFHSDAYSLEFSLAKFNFFRLQMALVLAERIEESKLAGSHIMEPLDVESALALADKVLIRNCSDILGGKA